ncbi:MAG: proteasome assembly chaperone family protein [Candidatus Marsarchaeota archaeon]|nr:proteasome assembly chaperone family protein [Candidatus Marsarchaeota archaeon]
MEKTVIKYKKGLKLNKPVLIVGLPGIGNVGKLVAEHLIKELKAERIATVYSPHFPHEVFMMKNGCIRMVSNRFYLIRRKGKQDIVVLTGDAQAVTPEGQYEVNHKLVRFFKEKLNGSFIYTIGGYNVSGSVVATPRVFGNATSKDTIKKFEKDNVLFGKAHTVIIGAAGLMLSFAKMEGMEGVCLMGESTFFDMDPAAAKAVLEMLTKRLGIKIDTTNMDAMIKKTAKALKELEKQLSGTMQLPVPGEGDNLKPSYIR